MPKTAVTRITHSCHLIEIGGRTLLTDPWFSTRPGYYQGEPIALSVADLPRLDGALISHEHYDHCDLQAFAAYRDSSVPLFAAETVVPLARKHGFTNVTALAPWEQAELGGVTITATPAKHGVYEVTFVLRAGSEAVYFAGDTMLIPELGEVYADAAAFAAHLRTEHVHTFISSIPSLSTGGPGSLIQLDELPVPPSGPEAETA